MVDLDELWHQLAEARALVDRLQPGFEERVLVFGPDAADEMRWAVEDVERLEREVESLKQKEGIGDSQ